MGRSGPLRADLPIGFGAHVQAPLVLKQVAGKPRARFCDEVSLLPAPDLNLANLSADGQRAAIGAEYDATYKSVEVQVRDL